MKCKHSFALSGYCPKLNCREYCYVSIRKSANLFEVYCGCVEELIICSGCSDYVLQKLNSGEVTVLSCHINGTVISHSTDSALLPVSSYLKPLIVDQIDNYKLATDLITSNSNVLVVAGAGLSADSFDGLTFRSAGGKLGGNRTAEEICYDKYPQYAWYYDVHIMQAANSSAPHGGYKALWNMVCRKNYFVFTSNIDNYLERSGFPGPRVYEAHGRVFDFQCMNSDRNINKGHRCRGLFSVPASAIDRLQLDHERCAVINTEELPRCPHCNGRARVNVSHYPDHPEDIDQTKKLPSKKRLLQWLFDNRDRDVLILDIGCGITEHSLLCEIQLLLSDHPISGLTGRRSYIRIDPGDSSGGDGNKYFKYDCSGSGTVKTVDSSTANAYNSVLLKDSALRALNKLNEV